MVAALGVAPVGVAAAASVVDGDVVCTVDDPRAVELSGLVATDNGYISEIDSQFDPDTIRVIYLDSACAVIRTVGYPTAARDPEDLAVDPAGTVWVADIGDNFNAQTRRSTIGLWRLSDGGGAPVIYRLSYPDGPHDAEALLFDGGGTPVIVTKELSGVAGIYRATGPLAPGTTTGVPLERVGEFRPPVTGAANPLGTVGEMLVTGAATSPDRRRVALRTYAAAFEWDVPDGDVVAAITKKSPRYTVLPNEPQGEAIAYTVDGKSFLTLSDEAGATQLRRYTPSTVGTPSSSPTEDVVTNPQPPPPDGPDWTLIVGLSALGAGLFALVMVGFLSLRRRRA